MLVKFEFNISKVLLNNLDQFHIVPEKYVLRKIRYFTNQQFYLKHRIKVHGNFESCLFFFKNIKLSIATFTFW